MAEQLNLTPQQAYAIADSLAQASARVLDYRVTYQDRLAPEDLKKLEECENALDHQVVQIRNHGIQLISAEAEGAVVELGEAIEAARTTITRIEQTRDAIRIAGSLIDLCVALTSKNPKAILAAAKAVKNTVATCA